MLLNKYKKKLSKLLSKLYDKPLPPPTDKEKDLVKELKTTFHDLPLVGTTNCCALEEWVNNTNRLRELVLNDDPREFLRWHVISATMFVKYATYITPELNYLKKRPDWDSRWSGAIKECPAGHPVPYYLYVSVQADLAKWCPVFTNDGAGMPSK